MEFAFAIVQYILFFFLTGGIFTACLSNERMRPADLLLVCFASGIFFPVFLFYALAVLKIFTVKLFLISWAAIVFSLAAYCYRTSRFLLMQQVLTSYPYGKQKVVFCIHLVVFVSFIFYFERPSEWLSAGVMDAGNYVIQAAYQLSHSSLFLDESLREVYRGFFPHALYPGDTTTGFYPTFPFPPLNKLCIAVLMIFHLKLGFYSSFLLALLGYIAIARLSVFCFNNVFTQLVTPFLAVSTPVYIFYATITMSEMLFVCTLLSSLALGYTAYKYSSLRLACFCGMVFASILAIRLEAVVYFLPWLAICSVLISTLPNKTDVKVIWGILLSTSVFALGFWYPCIESGQWYYQHHLKSLLTILNWLLVINFLYLVVLALLNRNGKYRELAVRLFTDHKVSIFVGGCLVLVLFLVVGLRYVLTDGQIASIADGGKLVRRMMKEEDMNILMSYTSPLLLLSGIAGAGFILFYRRYILYPVVFLFIVIAIVTLISPRHSIGDYWQVRRYLGSVFPLILFGSSACFEILFTRFQRLKIVPVAVILIWVLGSGYYVIKNNSEQDTHHLRSLVGMADSFTAHAGFFRDRNGVIIVDGNANISKAYMLAMRYVYNIETLNPMLTSITDKELLGFVSENWTKQRDVYFCGLDNEQQSRLNSLFGVERVEPDGVPALKIQYLYRVFAKK